MTIKHEHAHEAASMYYLQGLTMGTIARHLGISRSSVSRLLAYARDTGLVRITVAAPPGSRGTLSGQLRSQFGVTAWVVPVRDVDTELSRVQAVAQVAAERLTELMFPGATLGVAWGNTTSAVAQKLTPQSIPNTTVVQLNGAANALDTGTLYVDSIISLISQAFGARSIHFPVPAFFDYPETKQMLWKERSIRNVLQAIETCDIALFGVGSMDSKILSHVYSGGFLEEEELKAAKTDGVVGDVCTVLLREDGSTYTPIDRRASGPNPYQLQKIRTRLCVVAGEAKVRPLLGALRAGVVTELVVDSAVARAVLQRVNHANPKPQVN